MNISSKALSAIISTDNIMRLVVLIIGYFLGPYVGFLNSNQTLVASAAMALFTPTVIRSSISGIKYVNSVVGEVSVATRAILSSAVVGGGATFLFFYRQHLDTQVFMTGLGAILKSSASLAGEWWEKAAVMCKYCVSLAGVTLSNETVGWIADYVKKFTGSEILSKPIETVSQGASWFKLSPAYYASLKTKIIADQEPSFIFTTMARIMSSVQTTASASTTIAADAFNAAKTSLLAQIDQLMALAPNSLSYTNLSKAIQVQLDSAAIWADKTIPSVVKILASAKMYLQTAITGAYDTIVQMVGATNAPTVCWCIGLLIAGMGSTWLTKKLYDRSKDQDKITKSIEKEFDTECLTVYGADTLIALDLCGSIFATVARNAPEKEWAAIPYNIARQMKRLSANCEYTTELTSLFTALANTAKVGDATKTVLAFLKLLQEFYDAIIKYGDLLKIGGNEGQILFVDRVSKASLYEVEQQIELLVYKIQTNSPIASERKMPNATFFTLASASEGTNYQVGSTVYNS